MLLARDAGATFNRRLHGTEARGVLNELDPGTHLVGRRGVAAYVERDDGAVASQLFASDRVCRVAAKPRVPGERDARVRLQALRENHVRQRTGAH